MDPSVEAAFRAELRAFVRAAGTRRALPTTCHVGHPGGERTHWVHEGPDDEPSLRVDLVVRALDGLTDTSGAGAWVTRGGDLGVVDADAEWFAAVRAGFGHHGLEPAFFLVINRTGWVDRITGERRSWSRVRPAAHTGQVCTGSLACISTR